MNARAVTGGKLKTLQLQAGGTLNPRKHLYIERPDDALLLQLLSEGQYVNVLTSRQMGKSSLMVRTAQALVEQGVRCAIVDLAAELGSPEDAGTYFLGLLNKLARDLKIEVELPSWWVERTQETMNQRLMRFFREVVLEQVEGSVVCFLDEIDSTLKLPWTDDLFTALRGMHNARAEVAAYERLTFCLIGVAWPNELIKDRRTTPYNVGNTLELKDFDLERDDLRSLASALSSDRAQARALTKRVLFWTGGHPYLTIRLCASLQESRTEIPEDVDHLVDETFPNLDRASGDVHFQSILRFMETRFRDDFTTISLYRNILYGARERDRPAPAHIELKLSGLVKRSVEGCLVVRNRIYGRVFDSRWVESTLPWRRLRAYKRYSVVLFSTLFIGLGAAAIWIAYLYMQLDEQRQRVESMNISLSNEIADFPDEASQQTIQQAAPLVKAIGLRNLNLEDTQLKDLHVLRQFGEIQFVSLKNTQITSLEGIADLPRLKALNLWNTAVQDLAPLAGLTDLEWLDLSKTPVTGVAPLEGLVALKNLSLWDTRVSDAGPLKDLVRLEYLSLAGTHVEDISALSKLRNLEELDLSATRVVDLEPLSDLTTLQRLYLTSTQVEHIWPLAGLKNLQTLSLGGTEVHDLSPLRNLSRLSELNIWFTNVSDIGALAKLTSLRQLDLGGTKVSQAHVEAFERELAERGNTSILVRGP